MPVTVYVSTKSRKFKILINDSSKLFGYYFNHPGGYVMLKVVTLHCCGILLKISE